MHVELEAHGMVSILEYYNEGLVKLCWCIIMSRLFKDGHDLVYNILCRPSEVKLSPTKMLNSSAHYPWCYLYIPDSTVHLQRGDKNH